MKSVMIHSLLFASVAMASQYNYEITPLVGYNLTEGNLQTQDYAIIGGEIQLNNLDTFLNPELSGQLSRLHYENGESRTYLLRIAINGVYEFKNINNITPLAKIGLGYSYMNNPILGNNNSSFAEIGVGAKIPFNDYLALKVETLYIVVDNNSKYDNNLAILAGINFAFGLNSEYKQLSTLETQKEHPQELEVANTKRVQPAKEDDIKLSNSQTQEKKELPLFKNDDDKDGVSNSIDQCKATSAGYSINKFGCILQMVPSISFESRSSNLNTQNKNNIAVFAEFLKKSPAYSVEIVGHTDSTGTHKTNILLSKKRAQTVQELLVNEGIDIDRLIKTGMGESKPIATNKTANGRAQNRRVETKLIKTK